MSDLTKEELDKLERILLTASEVSPLTDVGEMTLRAVDMARRTLEAEAKVKELEDQREIARGIYPTLEKAEARIQELEAQAAAMRQAFENLRHRLIKVGWNDFWWETGLEQALSGEAGKALLEKVQSRTELIADLADSLRDFGGTQDERRGSRYRRAAEALDRADALARGVKSE